MGYMRRTCMFDKVDYQTKTSPVLREAMTRKVQSLRASINTREERIVRVRNEWDIDAERLAVLVMRFRDSDDGNYNNQGGAADEVLVPAGVIANLVRERELIDNEQQQIRSLELILRNLTDEEQHYHPETGQVCTRPALHQLEDDELLYLGF